LSEQIDDGVIKFDCRLTPSPAPATEADLTALNAWRTRLHALGLIGEYADAGVGYGNVSLRRDDGTVLVTGTQTGRLPRLGPEHYVVVVGCDLDRNRVDARGPLAPSSETLAHMALYEAIAECRAVFHAHDPEAWHAWRDRWPTTGAEVPYGTPAMARELARLYRETSFATERIAVMGGHADGIIAWGRTADEAGDVLVRRLRPAA
jgi:ribulose-5-phosphate 4-epimerase/fuculose-1-phosphate aldolase